MTYRKVCGECIKDCEGQQLDPLCVDGAAQCRMACFCEEGMVISNTGECILPELCETEKACTLEDGSSEVQASVQYSPTVSLQVVHKCSMHIYSICCNALIKRVGGFLR